MFTQEEYGIRMQSKTVADNFCDALRELVRLGMVTSTSFYTYKEASRISLHSKLQFCLQEGAHRSGLIGIPEFKVGLSTPLRPNEIDPRFKKGARNQFRVDVAFFEGGKYVGFGEVYTVDEIHGCEKSDLLKKEWTTPYHKLLHLADHPEKNFPAEMAILVNVIPKKLELHWKEPKQPYLDPRLRFQEKWVRLAAQLRSRIPDTVQIIVEEDEVLINGVSRSI